MEAIVVAVAVAVAVAVGAVVIAVVVAVVGVAAEDVKVTVQVCCWLKTGRSPAGFHCPLVVFLPYFGSCNLTKMAMKNLN